MVDIVYNQRYSTLQSYDTAWIGHLEDMGFTVDSLESSELEAYDYSAVKLVIVGAPGSNWIANHPQESFLAGLEVPIISMCRGTSRNAFLMSTSSGAANVSAFTVVDSTHDITDGLSGSTTIGTSRSTHTLWGLTASTNLIMHHGTADRAGLAEITATINGEDYLRIHWGYHNGEDLNSDGWDIFERTLEYLDVSAVSYKPSGYRISDGLLLSEPGQPIRIRWSSITPESTSVKVETAISESGSVVGENWEEQTNGELITNLPEDLEGKYLWFKITLETEDEEETPIFQQLWIEEEDPPGDIIIITMKDRKRFQNVEGNLTVEYDGAGSLEGLGGAVAGFEESFAPQDLERMPNPNNPVYINTSIKDLSILLIAIYHMVVGGGWDEDKDDFGYGAWPTDDSRHQKWIIEPDPPEEDGVEKGAWGSDNLDHIKTSIVDYTLNLIHVDDIDP